MFQIFFLLFAVSVLAAVTGDLPVKVRRVEDIQNDSTDDKNQYRYRLPNNTRPETYDIYLDTKVDQEIFNFTGLVKIQIYVVKNTRDITLHVRLLEILSVNLKSLQNQSEIQTLTPVLEKETDILTINTKDVELTQGSRYILTIKYAGNLRTDNAGFYRSSYTRSNGQKMYVIKNIN